MILNKINAQTLYDELISLNLDKQKGSIYFDMAGLHVKIDTTDTIGMTLQSWLKEYLIQNNYYFEQPKNTQEFPDFFLDDKESTENMLEIKTFNYKKSPGFDIANFDSYCSKIVEQPYCLYADYLIFAYVMDNGNISIKNLWLKKIWEIAGTSRNMPLKTQIKRNKIYNIRSNSNFKNNELGPFSNENSFLNALYGTISKDKSEYEADRWKKKFKENYEYFYGYSIEF